MMRAIIPLLILLATAFAGLAVPSTAQAEWIGSDGGHVPRGAVRAGREHAPGGEALFICRARFKNGIHPGKVRRGLGGCNVPWGGRENTVRSYEVLVGRGFGWRRARDGNIPLDAVLIGRENGRDMLFTCRANFKNGRHPGKVRPGLGGCNIPWGGREHTVREYQVLIAR